MLKNIFIALSFFIVSTPLLHGQDTALLKRSPYKLKVAVDKKTIYEEDLNETPYVLPDNTVQLYPGEIVFIEIDHVDGAIKSIKAVKEINDPAKTLTIKFTQTVSKKKHELMMLSVSNPFKNRLSYKAKIYLLTTKKWVSTNVYPIEPGLSGFETWSDIIISIALDNWTLQK